MRAVFLIAAILSVPAFGFASAKPVRHAAARRDTQAESHVQQIPPGVVDRRGAPPELAPEANKDVKAKPANAGSAPVACTPQNASSEACYTATQQSRPVTK